MAYRTVKYIICGEFWGTNIIAVPLSTNSGGTCPPVHPVIYAHAMTIVQRPLLPDNQYKPAPEKSNQCEC